MDTLALAPKMARYGQRSDLFGLGLMLTRKELCESLRMSERSFSRLRVDGLMPAGTWVGGKLMFRVEEVQRWLNQRTESPGRPYRG